MKYCPISGFERPKEENFCAHCGTPLVSEKPKSNPHKNGVPHQISVKIGETMECPFCHKNIPALENEFFCHVCGHLIINTWPYKKMGNK